MCVLSRDATSNDIFVGVVFGVKCVDCRKCYMVPAADQIRLVISDISEVTETIQACLMWDQISSFVLKPPSSSD